MRRACAAALAVLLAAGCSAGGGGPSSAPPPSPSARPGDLGVRYDVNDPTVSVRLVSLDRMVGKVVVARFVLRDDDDRRLSVHRGGAWAGPDGFGDRVDGDAMSGISVLDGASLRRSYPLTGTDGRCLCTGFGLASFDVPARGEREVAAVLPAPPPGTARLDVLFPNAAPFLDVPLRDVPAGPVALGDRTLDPSAAAVAEPVTVPVTSTVEDDAASEDDDGADLRVNLSTDVLFAVDEADLTPAARAVLRRTAQRIDQSAGPLVRIDGHADSTGDDAVNEPLSRRRAEAVERALKDLVTRADVRFRAAGHGSREPVASNGTADGRRRNRRVTVTFRRPAPPPASAPAPAASGDGRRETLPRPVLARAPVTGSPSFLPRSGFTWPKRGEAAVHALRRDANGYAALVWTIRDDDPDTGYDPRAGLSVTDQGKYGQNGPYAVRLRFDGKASRALHTEFETLGPQYGTAVASPVLRAGESLVAWAMFRVPSDVSSVTVDIPGFKSMDGVPVS
ncbi:OmpA family protein [Actinomadura atramentaria]|uniref:OmpA family protein n=1 Tax=Actinomadura atramentaria TaxID=1990 RepID=UPI00037D94AA|nr:OmpA family protein [Actinomadura atramentaria]